MKARSPVLLCTVVVLLASRSRQGSPNLGCVFDSKETLTCIWELKNTPEAQCQLTASVTYGKPPKTCQLQGAGNRTCELVLQDYSLTVTDIIYLNISCLFGENWMHIQSQEFVPFKNIQFNPPCDVQLEVSSEPSYNLTWKICTISHYLDNRLRYEVSLRNDSGGIYQILQNKQDQKWMKIENLSPDTVYEAAVRTKLQQDNYYKSTWSNWSPPVTWRTRPNVILEAPPGSTHLPVISAIGSLMAITFLVAVFFITKTPTAKCFAKLLKIHIPNPSEFFPSLTSDYGGDIQKWLSSPLSTASFHIATADVSVLEIVPKGHPEHCLLLSNEKCKFADSQETSGHSSSSCFTNRGYFFFHHHDSLEIEPCKVYFTYNPVVDESRSSSEEEDSGSYKELHEMEDNQVFSAYGGMENQNDSSLEETKDPNQKSGKGSEVLTSRESFSVTPAVEQDKNEETSVPTVQPTASSKLYSNSFSGDPEKPGSSTDRTESCSSLKTPTKSAEDRKFAFLQSAMIQNPDQANLSRTTSSGLMPSSSEPYLSLRDLQSHISHHSF